MNAIVSSTKELNEVGGDITKVAPQTRKTIEDLTKTGGGRWRFEYQINGLVNQYLEYVGVKDNALFQNMSDAEKKRLFDVPNQMNYLDEVPENIRRRDKRIKSKKQEKMVEQQAASYAIQQNPKDASEFVNHTEFYKSQIEQKIVELEKQYTRKLEIVVDEIATREEIEADIDKFTSKQKTEANRTASKEFFEELYGEATQFDCKNSVNKYLRKIAYENSGTRSNFEQLKPQTLEEIQNIYQTKIAEIGDNIGGVQIESKLSSQQIIQQIKVEADNLKFADESAAAYHTEKHYDEFPPSHKTEDNKFNNYWQSAIETVKKSTNVTSSYEQLSGSQSFVFKHIYQEGDDIYQLQTIVGISQDGTTNIRTYFSF